MRQVAHVLLTRPPLVSLLKEIHSLDLHVLGTPPAFVLSQDQTLDYIVISKAFAFYILDCLLALIEY